jgi:hypothetical protein
MGRMADRGSPRSRGLGTRRRLAALVAGFVASTLVAGCTTDESGPPEPDQLQDAALRVTTLPVAGVDEETRAELESEVGDVLAGYVVGSFLGDYPRGDFVQGFADFTNRAAGYAVVDIEQVTAVRFADATSLRATRLEAELSFLVLGGEAVGATAWVDFEFEVVDEGEVTTATLTGPISLDRRGDRWAVFGYRLKRDDSDSLPAETVS